MNAMGRLLMELREKYVLTSKELKKVEPLNITGFLLYGYEIETVYSEAMYAVDF